MDELIGFMMCVIGIHDYKIRIGSSVTKCVRCGKIHG